MTTACVAATLIGLPITADHGNAAAPAEGVDAGEIVSAFATLRGWVDAFDLPDPDAPESAVALSTAGGGCVILRRSGRVLGTGVATGDDDRMLRRAAGRALGAVLGDPRVVNLPPEIRDTIGTTLSIELEIAGKPVPLLARDFQSIADQIDPGLDGVALRRGDRWALLFPAQLRATNTTGRMSRRLSPMAREIGLTPMPLEELRRGFDVSVYRFPTTHLAQLAPDRAPRLTSRGETTVSEESVTFATMTDAARQLIRRIIRLEAPIDHPIGIMGTYRPVADLYDPIVAPPLEQAMAALALARAAGSPHLDCALRADAAAAAGRILYELYRVTPGTEKPPLTEPATCAVVVLAAHEGIETNGDTRLFITKAKTRLLESFAADTGFETTLDATGADVQMTSHHRAIIASALASVLRRGDTTLTVEVARGALDDAWSSVPEHQHVGLLPWIGWGEINFAQATGSTSIAHRDDLERLRSLLEASRIGSADRGGPADLRGGFSLGSGDRLAATAQSLRPAAFLATMVGHPGLSPRPQRAIELDRLLSTVRFIMQLMVSSEELWAFRSPHRAIGGVQAALWDRDQPVGAQVLGLMTILETLDILADADLASDTLN